MPACASASAAAWRSISSSNSSLLMAPAASFSPSTPTHSLVIPFSEMGGKEGDGAPGLGTRIPMIQAAALVAEGATYPIDMVKTRMQLSAKKVPQLHPWPLPAASARAAHPPARVPP